MNRTVASRLVGHIAARHPATVALPILPLLRRSPASHSAGTSTKVADPTRIYSAPTGQNEFAITYLPTSASTVNSSTSTSAAVIGWSTTNASASTDLSPLTFRANPGFVNVLHATLREHAHTDPELMALAQHQKIGWLHLADARNPPPWGRIPDPDDIVGSVLIGENGKIVAGSYQHMPTHRLVSSQGLFVLSAYLHSKLMERLKTL